MCPLAVPLYVVVSLPSPTPSSLSCNKRNKAENQHYHQSKSGIPSRKNRKSSHTVATHVYMQITLFLLVQCIMKELCVVVYIKCGYVVLYLLRLYLGCGWPQGRNLCWPSGSGRETVVLCSFPPPEGSKENSLLHYILQETQRLLSCYGVFIVLMTRKHCVVCS